MPAAPITTKSSPQSPVQSRRAGLWTQDFGLFSEQVTGFWLRVEWLWQQPLPLVDDVLLEIGGEAYARQWIERLRRHGFLSSAESGATS